MIYHTKYRHTLGHGCNGLGFFFFSLHSPRENETTASRRLEIRKLRKMACPMLEHQNKPGKFRKP